MLKVEQTGEHEWEFVYPPVPPKTLFPDRYTVGGDDEAYYYWERNGILWEEPEVKEWLAQAAGKGRR